MRSRSLILISFLCSILYYNCLGDKTCSDEDKSCSVQAAISSFLSVPDGVYIYSTITKYQGNLASYGSTLDESTQNICKNEKLFSSLINQYCPEVRAIIPTPLAPLYNFETVYGLKSTSFPVFGPTGITIIDGWSNMVSGEAVLNISLAAAGLGTEKFWSFSDTTGNVITDTCNNGTDTTGTYSGALGYTTSTDSDWLNLGGDDIDSCDVSYRVLCVCFTPDTSLIIPP
ncbi:hypothetical protein EHQ52_12065 [Leptospira koniambonensis]|uniref:DUF1554 domain-containing protein n=1 Tax=Leptospira koniambonensis TaxID=2484950 RepID=A0A4R9J9T2_9LEPT|nr:hypothetical protein [Leptospira koniambonensis]TGL35205.1 hypothetical protein EHQ52_12065 [Leptospira koniambonensis]